MAPPPPIAGYSFDAQTGEDEVGVYDLVQVYAGYTTSAKHGSHAVAGGNFGMFASGPESHLGVTPFSMAAWFYVPSGQWVNLDAWSPVGAEGVRALIEGGVASVIVAYPLTTVATASNTVVADAWNLLMYGQRGDGAVWVALNDGAPAVSAPQAALYVDTWQATAGSSDVRIDTFAVWDAPLTADDVAWLWNGGTGRTIADLVAAGAPHDLTATGVATGAPTLGTPALTMVVALTAPDIAAEAPTVGAPRLWDYYPLTPAERTAVIAAEARAWVVKRDVRVVTVAGEDRVHEVAAENRVVTVQ